MSIDITNPCQICLEKEIKYTCPKCQTKTCSLECVKTHKEQSDCDGKVNNTEYIRRQEFQNNETFVQRDYNFLMGLNRSIDVAKQETRVKNRKILTSVNKRFQKTTAQNNEYQSVTKRGVIVRNLPRGMQRANQNKSGWDKKTNTYMWTIEYILVDSETGDEIVRHNRLRVPEGDVLKDSIHMAIQEAFKEEDFFCFLKKIDTHNKLISLDNNGLIADVLRDQTVIEYPSIIISKQNWIKGYDLFVEEETPTSDESSTEESDTESESGSESEKDDDKVNEHIAEENESGPEEESSKQKK